MAKDKSEVTTRDVDDWQAKDDLHGKQRQRDRKIGQRNLLGWVFHQSISLWGASRS